MSLAAVVIPTRNRRPALERAIESVRHQSESDWEVVVVDDASTDETPEFLATMDDPRVRFIRLDERSERSAARNRGLELVSAAGVLFLDDDDELLPGALGALASALKANPAVCASVGAVIHEDNGLRRVPHPRRPVIRDIRLELLAGWVGLSGQSMFRTSVVRDAGGWREDLLGGRAEDQELWLRVAGRGPVALVPEVVLLHRPHGLAGNAPGWRETERDVVRSHIENDPGRSGKARRAAQAREHLRDADIAFQLGAYSSALGATVRGLVAAPFLLGSPLVGRGIARGLVNSFVATVLPRAATDRLRAARRRRRTTSLEAAR